LCTTLAWLSSSGTIFDLRAIEPGEKTVKFFNRHRETETDGIFVARSFSTVRVRWHLKHLSQGQRCGFKQGGMQLIQNIFHLV
jgi:hypothetical protein